MTYLENLYQEINGVTEIIAPKESKEKLNGEEPLEKYADEAMQKIFSLHSSIVFKINDMKKAFYTEYDPTGFLINLSNGDGNQPEEELKNKLEEKLEELKKFYGQIKTLEEKDDVLMDLFWASAHEKVGTEHPALAINPDWEIIAYEPYRQKQEPEDPLMGMFSGGITIVGVSTSGHR